VYLAHIYVVYWTFMDYIGKYIGGGEGN